MQTGHGGLLTHVKNDLLNHLELFTLLAPLSNCWGWRGYRNVPQQGPDDTVLIAPFGLASVAHTFGLCLHHLSLLLCFPVYPIQWDNLESFVEEPRVLVLSWRRR